MGGASWIAILIYSLLGAAVLLAAVHGAPPPVRPTDPPAGRTGCKGCGK